MQAAPRLNIQTHTHRLEKHKAVRVGRVDSCGNHVVEWLVTPSGYGKRGRRRLYTGVEADARIAQTRYANQEFRESNEKKEKSAGMDATLDMTPNDGPK